MSDNVIRHSFEWLVVNGGMRYYFSALRLLACYLNIMRDQFSSLPFALTHPIINSYIAPKSGLTFVIRYNKTLQPKMMVMNAYRKQINC